MQLKIYKGLWGDAESVAGFADLQRIKQAGYDGIEWAVPNAEPAAWRDWCATLGLDYVGMAFAARTDEIEPQLKTLAAYGPQHITMHSGRDKMTFAEGRTFLQHALAVERDLGIPVGHETHRHRLFYTPWTTAQYLDALPDLKLCADFSHWCCVCESLLTDMEAWVTRACERTLHVHARVGWEESAQVADPRAPEVAHYVARHEEWWDRIRTARVRAGAEVFTLTPEYGPPGYMPAIPFTRQPITNLWDVCLWSAERLRQRWK